MKYLIVLSIFVIIGCTQQPRIRGQWETDAAPSNKLRQVMIIQELGIFGLYEEGFDKLLYESMQPRLEAYSVETINGTEPDIKILEADEENLLFRGLYLLIVKYKSGVKLEKATLSFFPKEREYDITKAVFLVTLEDSGRKRHFSARIVVEPYSPGLAHLWSDPNTTDIMAESIVNSLLKAGFL